MNRRGFCETDKREFGPKAMEDLRRAGRDIVYLLNRGYPMKSAVKFVGDHYLLSARQRLALQRCTAPESAVCARLEKKVPLAEARGQAVCIDGFNLVIPFETWLCGSLLFRGSDGALRDLAGLRGTYRLLQPETWQAVTLVRNALTQARAQKAIWYLDQPVSNSGRLRSCIEEVWDQDEAAPVLETRILPDVDRQLMQQSFVASSDAIILDACSSWLNLAGEIVPLVPSSGRILQLVDTPECRG